jgi:hypothetical protein
MIVFDLRCRDQGHVFEGWFGSSADYESQRERGLVQCPLCGAAEVDKAVMAPRVGAKGNRSAGESAPIAYSDPERVKALMAAMAAAQKALLANSSNVGERFAAEARAMHLGEIEARPIHGRTTREETESLIEDGVPVAPLPFPVIEPGEEN